MRVAADCGRGVAFLLLARAFGRASQAVLDGTDHLGVALVAAFLDVDELALAIDDGGWVEAFGAILVLVIGDKGEALILDRRKDDEQESGKDERGGEAEDEGAEVHHAWEA